MPTLLDILAEYGVVSAVLVTFLIIIFALLKSRTFNSSLSYDPDSSSDRRQKVPLYTHQFFSNVEFKINIDLPIETFSEHPSRNIMYQDIMVILFTTYLKNMKAFVKAFNDQWNADDWRYHINKAHYNLIEEFKANCLKAEIPEAAIKLFMTWYNPYLNRTYQYINHVAKMSEVGPDGKTRVFLLVLELILATVTADAQRQSILNGELSGMEYKGLVL